MSGHISICAYNYNPWNINYMLDSICSISSFSIHADKLFLFWHIYIVTGMYSLKIEIYYSNAELDVG